MLQYNNKKMKPDSESNEIVSKFIATRNVIKNKFAKACMNRMEHERDEREAIKPLTSFLDSRSHALNLKSKGNESKKMSLLKSPIKTDTKIYRSYLERAIKMRKIQKNKEKKDDPNELCNRLKKLLKLQIASNGNHEQEVHSIIKKLHDLDIFV